MNIIQIMAKMIPKRSVNPIYTHMEISIHKKQQGYEINFRGINETFSLVVSEEVQSLEQEIPPKCLINCHEFHDIFLRIDADEVTIEFKKGYALLRKENQVSFKLNYLQDSMDHYNIDNIPLDYNLDCKNLQDLVSSIGISLEKGHGQVSLIQKNNTLTLLSNDRMQAAWGNIPNIGKDFQISVAINFLYLYKKFFKTGEVKMGLNNKYLILKNNNIVFISKILPIPIVYYKRFLPQGDYFLINRKSFLKALKTIKISTSDINSAVHIEFDKQEGLIKLSSFNPISGTRGYVEIIEKNIAHGQCKLNVKRLVKVVELISCDKIRCYYTKTNKPLVITNNEENAVFYILMPIFLG